MINRLERKRRFETRRRREREDSNERGGGNSEQPTINNLHHFIPHHFVTLFLHHFTSIILHPSLQFACVMILSAIILFHFFAISHGPFA